MVMYIDTTASFGVKLSIERVGGNRKGIAVSCLRHLGSVRKRKSGLVE